MKKVILLTLILVTSAFAQGVVIGPPVFSGAGLNDATSGGAFSSFPANAVYVATISATGTPDHFTWTKNGGSSSSPVAIVAGAIALSDGVTIKFAATTGHTVAASWTIKVSASGSLAGLNTIVPGVGAVTQNAEAKARQIVSVADFGAKLDGAADDTAAWQAAIASLLQPPWIGGTVTMPAHVTSITTTGITINTASGQFLRIVGQGNSSVIQCTGVTCITWSGTAAQASGMEGIFISDPTGNASTIGLYLNGGSAPSGQTNLRFTNMLIRGNSNLQSGGHFAGLGIGVLLKNTVLPRFENVQVAYFNIDVQQTGFVNSFWFQSYFYGAGSIGWDVEASGDNYASQTDFEGNTGSGIYLGTGAQNTSVTQSHFESNAGNHFEIAGTGAQLASGYNEYAGGTALVDSGGAVFLSTGFDSMSALTLTNNSNGGGSGLAGATVKDSFLGPTIVNGAGGCTVTSLKGVPKATGAGCSLPFSVTGYTNYKFDNPLSASVGSGSLSNGAVLAIDLNTVSTDACYQMVSKVVAYVAATPTICWNSGTGGFDFFPSVAIGGGYDYTWRNAAGSSLLQVTDGAVWNFPSGVLNAAGLYTAGGTYGLSNAGALNQSGALGCTHGTTTDGAGTFTGCAPTPVTSINGVSGALAGATGTFTVLTGCTVAGGVPTGGCSNTTFTFTNGLKQ